MTNQPKHLKEKCPKRDYWCSFRLVNEQGDSGEYAGLAYALHDRWGDTYSGVLDTDGYARIENFYCGPLRLDFTDPHPESDDSWYNRIATRESFKLPLTALQVAAEQTPIAIRDSGHPDLAKQRAKQENATFYRVEVRDFVKLAEAAHLPEFDNTLTPRPSPSLKLSCEDACDATKDLEKPGIALGLNRHHVLEVKALRAYSPIFSEDKAFCAINAYHLSVMCMLSYADFNVTREPKEKPTPPPYKTKGAIGTVLQSELACAIKPTCFEEAEPYHLLLEEVPYSKRLEVMPYDPARYAEETRKGWEFPEHVHFLNNDDETQAFMTHNDKVVLLSVRGTAGGPDTWRDLDARQVPHENGVSETHRGFYQAFVGAKEFVRRYMRDFYIGQTILVCGHSLGGAIALLLGEWLNRSYPDANVMLYTYGAPRTGNGAFVKAAAGLTHHRLVNHNDPIPGVPFTWLDAEWKTLVPAAVMSVSSGPARLAGIGGVVASLVNMEGDYYEHHGEQRHFIPRKPGAGSEAKVLWQPGCAMLEKLVCAEYAAELQLQGDMPQGISFGETVMSIMKHFDDHSSNTGYARAALSNLLRWRASVIDRKGKLFSFKETEQLTQQVRDIEAELKAWVPNTYAEFYSRVQSGKDPRLKGLTQLELQALFNDARARVTALAASEEKQLKRTRKRLQAQAESVISWKDVFGDQADREDLDVLLAEWLQLADIQKAARLAKASYDSNQKIA